MSFQDSQQRLLVSAERSDDFDAGKTFARHFDDYDEMAASAAKWNQEYFKIGRESAGGSLRASQTARMQLGLAEFHTGLSAQGTNPPNCVTFLLRTGGSPLCNRGHEVARNEIVVLPAGPEFACHIQARCSLVAFSLNESYLRHQAYVLAHADIAGGFRSVSSLHMNEGSDQKLTAAVAKIVLATWSRPQLLTSPIAAKRFEDEIASLLVAGVTIPVEYDGTYVRHRAARRALDYIRANAEELVTISDLCLEIGASQRTLEIGFQELFGTPPKVYLTMLRLHRARRELLATDRARVSVTDVATRWGFFHFGRFAEAYRERFGEVPNATVKRRMIERSSTSRRSARRSPPQVPSSAARVDVLAIMERPIA